MPEVLKLDILNSNIHDVGEVPHNGTQHGVAVYYRGYFPVSHVRGKISGNVISGYQKGGVTVNGQGVSVSINNNHVIGDGHVTFIAQNGIQVGYGASAKVENNDVSGNSFIGFPGDGSASGGILVVGGPGYGSCPDGNDCPYTSNVAVSENELRNNDVGVYFTNLQADFSAPTAIRTNNKAVENEISSDQCFNTAYQAAVSDQGNGDKIIENKISGPGYIGCKTVLNPAGNAIDADPSFTNNVVIRENEIGVSGDAD